MVEQWVKDLVGPTKMTTGATLKHPDGYEVKIVAGQYWGEYGLSNFWYWKRYTRSGRLSRKTEHGYGWC